LNKELINASRPEIGLAPSRSSLEGEGREGLHQLTRMGLSISGVNDYMSFMNTLSLIGTK